MRTRKSIINLGINIISFIILFIPNIIIRTIFLTSLGSDMLGLYSLYSNIIGWLSIFEMGVGTAIIFSLYEPYSNKDEDRIRGYISFYKRFYRRIGIIMLLCGLFISPLLNLMINGQVDNSVVIIGFILYLLNSVMSYMFSHKICILNVAQQSYKVTIGVTLSKLTIMIGQVIILKVYSSFILFIFVQIMINGIYFFMINKYITKKFPWIDKGNASIDKEEEKSLLKNVRAMFMHKIGSLVVESTDNMVLSKFIGLSAVTKYTNYQMIIIAFQNIISMALNGLTASIGNLLVQNDIEKSYKVHKRIFFMNFWVTSFIVISLFNTLNQFIVLWVGKEYLLDNLTFNVILINVYFNSLRGSVEQFQMGSGKFYEDRYAPISEAIINLTISIILVNKIGIAGVFIGTLASNLLVIFWTKPYIIYKYVFNKSIVEYFKVYLKYLIICIATLNITNILVTPFKLNYTIWSFVLNCIINIICINFVYVIIFKNTSEFKYYSNLIKSIIKNTLIKNTLINKIKSA